MINILRAKFKRTHIAVQLFVILVFLNLLDFQTTKALVDVQGFEVEANPILRYFMFLTGTVYAILGIKVLVMSFFCFWFCKADADTKQKFVPVLALGNIMFGLVCSLNLYYVWLIYGPKIL